MEVDDQGWVKEHPVYCPVPWCAAHNLRFARCGDQDGDYEGIHVARIKYALGMRCREQRRVAALKRNGIEDPDVLLGLLRLNQDAIDMGMAPGNPGKRRT